MDDSLPVGRSKTLLRQRCWQAIDGHVPMTDHDISLDALGTPTGVVLCARPFARPTGLLSHDLPPAKRDAIPALSGRRAAGEE